MILLLTTAGVFGNVLVLLLFKSDYWQYQSFYSIYVLYIANLTAFVLVTLYLIVHFIRAVRRKAPLLRREKMFMGLLVLEYVVFATGVMLVLEGIFNIVQFSITIMFHINFMTWVYMYMYTRTETPLISFR